MVANVMTKPLIVQSVDQTYAEDHDRRLLIVDDEEKVLSLFAQCRSSLFANARVTPADADRMAAINEFGGDATSSEVATRGRALRRVAENSTLGRQEFNKALVLMEYFGYLRRTRLTRRSERLITLVRTFGWIS